MLLITHDPHLVELVAERLWLVADGTVRPFDGDLDEYRTLLAERLLEAGLNEPDREIGCAARRERHDDVDGPGGVAGGVIGGHRFGHAE